MAPHPGSEKRLDLRRVAAALILFWVLLLFAVPAALNLLLPKGGA